MRTCAHIPRCNTATLQHSGLADYELSLLAEAKRCENKWAYIPRCNTATLQHRARTWIVAECKHRQTLPAWLKDALGKVRAQAGAHRLGVVVLHEHGARDSIVCLAAKLGVAVLQCCSGGYISPCSLADYARAYHWGAGKQRADRT